MAETERYQSEVIYPPSEDSHELPRPHPPGKPAPRPVREPGRPEPEIDDPERRVPQRTSHANFLYDAPFYRRCWR